jgi:signal recognition particle subunit SRP54
MTGQDAIKSAGEFNRRIGVTGVVLSKFDGDARGGAALSVAAVVGVPIAFTGVGERIEDLEPFHADRLVSRILGMGDVLSLIERAEQAIDRDEAARLTEQVNLNDFTLENFRDQLRAVRKMGPVEQLMGMIPGAGHLQKMAGQQPDDKQLSRVEAIVSSMTDVERRNHQVINGSRRKRIARGSGTKVEDVNRLLKQFIQMRKVFKTLGGAAGKGKGRRRAMQMLQSRLS